MPHKTLPMHEPTLPQRPATQVTKRRHHWLAWFMGAVAFGLLGVGGYTATGPYRTLSQLRDALERNDANLLSQCVDFPTLRQNLKLQLTARANNGVTAVVPSGILSQIVGGIAGNVIDASVDALVTPAGLSRLLAGAALLANAPSPAGEPPGKRLENAHGAFESVNKFLLTVPSPAGDVVVELTRSGFDWPVTNVRTP